jgi:hypothetical protein
MTNATVADRKVSFWAANVMITAFIQDQYGFDSRRPQHWLRRGGSRLWRSGANKIQKRMRGVAKEEQPNGTQVSEKFRNGCDSVELLAWSCAGREHNVATD